MTITASVDSTLTQISAGTAPGTACSPDLVEKPWVFDLKPPGYGPGSSMGDVIPVGSPRQGALPAFYREADAAELDRRIRAAKATLGERLVILGHFYQRDEVLAYADYVGDSFQLATAARERTDAEAIVFCGVHFMAETADLLLK